VHRIRTIVAAGLVTILTSSSRASRAETPDTWPRQLDVPDAVIVVYQPHIDAWNRGRLRFCAAVTVQATGADQQVFGAIWGVAHAEVDRVARRVTLSALRLTRSNFPELLDNGAARLRELRKRLKAVVVLIALDRLEAAGTEPRRHRARESPPTSPGEATSCHAPVQAPRQHRPACVYATS
jgi:hypothetical protein